MTNPWLSVQLAATMSVNTVTIINMGGRNANRLGHHQIWIGSASGQYGPHTRGSAEPALLCADQTAPSDYYQAPLVASCGGMTGSYVTIVLVGSNRLLNFMEVIVDADMPSPLPPPAPPAPPPNAPPPPVTNVGVLELTSATPVQLLFSELTSTNLPRGSVLGAVALHVTPRSGRGGALVAAVRAALVCSALNFTYATAGGVDAVEWDVQPYDLGFSSDQSPNLAPLLAEASL